MKKYTKIIFIILCYSLVLIAWNTESKENNVQPSKDPLPSWNETQTKSSIINYVKDVTTEGSENFIPISDRIATFDNDGNLWAEQPMYFQLFFAIDQVKKMAKDHPEWQSTQPFKSILDNDLESLKKQGMEGVAKIVMTTHSGQTTDEFDKVVKSWANSAKHPTSNKKFSEMVYQPMLELLSFLRANHFKTYIVSGGGVDFMRAFLPEVYGIPKEQIIGSRIKTEFNYNNGKATIKRIPELDYNDDKEGKPLNIQKIIGKIPVFASGNSDGDLQMLQYTDSNTYKTLKLYLHHTDADREWAYDRNSHIGKLDKGLDQALRDHWTIIDMKKDWKIIYPYQLK